MFQYDFSNHQNRFIRLRDMPAGYFSHICRTAQEDPFYPSWHIAPAAGLLNDPCGLVQKDGVHYIFHQWFPAGPVHGLKHWRLLTTHDFVHYQDHGPVLEPGLPFDDHGCHTGTAISGACGVELFYTGVHGEELVPCIAHAFVQDHAVIDRRPVVRWSPELSSINFRDPCVFEQNHRRYMLVGAENLEHKGCLILYQQADNGDFELLGPVDLDGCAVGYMLECPNYFEADGSGVMIFSPMGLKGENRYDFKNVFSVVYAKGNRLDCRTGTFSCDHFFEMDKGFDFYAPQTYRDEQGRQILFGWLGNSKSAYPTDPNQWAHMLTAPREITWSGDYMVQNPISELRKLRGGSKPIAQNCNIPFTVASFDLDCVAENNFSFEIGNEHGEKVVFSASEQEFCLDRSGMTYLYAEAFGTKRYARRKLGKQRLRVLADHSSLEVFADDGQTVFTSRFFLREPSYLQTYGMTGTYYDMNPIQIDARCKNEGPSLTHTQNI